MIIVMYEGGEHEFVGEDVLNVFLSFEINSISHIRTHSIDIGGGIYADDHFYDCRPPPPMLCQHSSAGAIVNISTYAI